MVRSGRIKNAGVKQDAFVLKDKTLPLPSPNQGHRLPLPFRLGKALKALVRHRLEEQAQGLFSFPYQDQPEQLLKRFLEVAEEDAETNPIGIVEEAIPLFLRLTPYYAVGLGSRGRISQGLIIELAMAAWRLLHGPKPPGDYPFSVDLWDYYQRLINTARLFLMATRR